MKILIVANSDIDPRALQAIYRLSKSLLNAALSHLKIIKFVGGLLNLIWPFASKVKHFFR